MLVLAKRDIRFKSIKHGGFISRGAVPVIATP